MASNLWKIRKQSINFKNTTEHSHTPNKFQCANQYRDTLINSAISSYYSLCALWMHFPCGHVYSTILCGQSCRNSKINEMKRIRKLTRNSQWKIFQLVSRVSFKFVTQLHAHHKLNCILSSATEFQ